MSPNAIIHFGPEFPRKTKIKLTFPRIYMSPMLKTVLHAISF